MKFPICTFTSPPLSTLTRPSTFLPRSLHQTPPPIQMAPTRRTRPLTSAERIQPAPETGQGSLAAGQVRVRQHLNPLARRWSQPVHLPKDWYEIAFADPTLALTVDIGVAKGRFLHKLALKHPDRNFLGLEIREPLVHQANRAAADCGLRNLFFVACNANVSLRSVLGDVRRDALQEVYVQFCDPWFKRRHAKRRMVNLPLVDDVFEALVEARRVAAEGREGRSGRVFMQSDVVEVAEEMRAIFDGHRGFQRVAGLEWDADGWLIDNPIGEPTERETAVLDKAGRVYRALYALREDADGKEAAS